MAGLSGHRKCTVAGCPDPRRSAGALYCERHYNRVRRHGNTRFIPYEERKRPELANDVGYTGAYRRVRKVRGPASNQTCACGRLAGYWKYNGRDMDDLTSDRGTYSLDASYYDAVCGPCKNAK